ncbi:FAR-17a/AIG1-like protein [Zychaea mexicana]|uniref:FAR-17a/AIG1-like protein n=1 Tax=Zychaea mexicana TaxID=64656 RepID=UPI0022FE35DC|nr:FAR-17a/AIG1-like protein [Zychaea mexicana]KAI9499571.1 FAR-17a/AIG1-like protein [Zychaea mexicana]
MKNHTASVLINTIGLASNLSALYCVHWVYENPYAIGFGGHFQYLTILGLSTATIAFLFRLFMCFMPGVFEAAYEFVFNLALPLEGLVCCLYWGMSLIDPTFITPKDMPPIPLIVDCTLHLYPAVFLWIDFLIFNTEFRRSARHVTAIYGSGISYYVWSCICHSMNSHYPYPFLDKMSEQQRIMFYAVASTLAWCMYEIGALLHSKLHDVSATVTKGAPRASKKL